MRPRALAWDWLFGVALAAMVMSPTRASADAVEPPPERCPAGTQPSSSHAGPICRPNAECTEHTTCPAGESCRPISFCIEIRDCGGLRPSDDECTLEHVVSECGAGTRCEFGPCVTRTVCAEPAAAPPAPETAPVREETVPPAAAEPTSTPASASSSGCHATRGVASLLGSSAMLAAALTTLAWRRKRKP